MANRREQITNILKGLNPLDPKVREDFGEGFKDDFSIGREDTTKMFYRQRELEGNQTEAPRWDSMMGNHPGIIRTKELFGKTTPEQNQALKESKMNLRGTPAHKAGQMLGTAAGDVTQDRSRSIWWLLNALQATGEVINEKALAKAAPSLYGKTAVKTDKGDRNLQMRNKRDLEYMVEQKMVRPEGTPGDMKYVPSRGYSTQDGELHKRNYNPGMIQALAIPTGIAINSGLGLLTPFGGAEGYKAALPSEEDASKTSNVIGEVGLKYIMGRTGQLLPYNEFSQVRPDVSREEYNKYQAFKYDKNEDYNPLDGDFSIGAGAIRGTTEGIHGPEIQFLGRSLPVTTGVVPYASALAGGVIGARMGAPGGKAASRGLIGGMAGLAVGQIGGNIIEQERRRRNSVENQLDGGNAEGYLR